MEIDAKGLTVAPGFIDIHSHSDWVLLEDGNALSKIRQDPFQYNEGIEYVIVNGKLVLDRGKHTGARPGRALRKSSANGFRSNERRRSQSSSLARSSVFWDAHELKNVYYYPRRLLDHRNLRLETAVNLNGH